MELRLPAQNATVLEPSIHTHIPVWLPVSTMSGLVAMAEQKKRGRRSRRSTRTQQREAALLDVDVETEAAEVVKPLSAREKLLCTVL